MHCLFFVQITWLAGSTAERMQATSFSGRVAPCAAGSRCVRAQAVTADRAQLDITKMAPLGDRVLVKPRENEKKTAGGIILASTSSNDFDMSEGLVGEVIAVGGKVKIEVKPGETVMYSKYGTSDVELADGKVTFVSEGSIMAVLQ